MGFALYNNGIAECKYTAFFPNQGISGNIFAFFILSAFLHGALRFPLSPNVTLLAVACSYPISVIEAKRADAAIYCGLAGVSASATTGMANCLSRCETLHLIA